MAAAAEGGINRLQELRALRAERGFDPFAVMIDEIQRTKGPAKTRLSAKERVQAAEALALLEFRYEQLEADKAKPAKGMRGSVRADMTDGQLSIDFQMDELQSVPDETIEARIRARLATLGIDNGRGTE